ncbi:MAG: 2Fe-2S iron-sulfur cluster binding domain-containing protein [Gemmatimonadetes bacterium]|jgi:NADH-quinone oxidoreductase subunit G|nr:2Fe-2S iron-sulfur cluster binding domain-containing protein [Gemmatimonadota bacterium]MBT6146235.1 2Fe-2S iron-sulfur cluster binding domain-containing protein [Gemmatimonadota bacterium]
MMATTCHIRIDGKSVEATTGQSLLECLQSHGVQIPGLCHHPGLSTPATCRSCLVLVEEGDQPPRPLTACNHAIADGMVIHVSRQDSRALREGALAEMLQRHKVDCPACERAGECELQEAIAGHGPATTPHELSPAVDRRVIGPRLVFDAGRCTACGRCARFEDEVSGTRQLAMSGRANTIDVVSADGGVDHLLAGNLIDLCPSGALVDPQAIYAPPAWSLRAVDTVCGGCSTGCAVRADVDADGKIQRLRPRQDEAVNDWWMCDRGRYDFDAMGGPRLLAPMPAGPEEDNAWQVGVDRLRRRMDQPRSAVWLSPYLSLEEAFLLIEAARQWNAHLYHWTAEEEPAQRFASGFRIGSEAAPNGNGLHRLFETLQIEVASTTQLQSAIESGQVGQLLMCGGGPLGQRPVLSRGEVAFVAAHDLVDGADADLVMPASHWLEKDGTFLNHDAHLRRVRPARSPAAGQTDLNLMLCLAGREAMPAAQVFAELVGQCSWLEGADYASLDEAARIRPQGVAAGGAWLDSLQRRGLIRIEDPAR